LDKLNTGLLFGTKRVATLHTSELILFHFKRNKGGENEKKEGTEQ
jgi:hypothetical protein